MTATYSKPTTIPRWADTTTNIQEPSSGKKDLGWLVGEKGVSSWENWKSKSIGDWIKWLNERVSDGTTKDALRILCPKTGTQTLEIDDNIVRFFEVATQAEQVSIRKSTSKDELQLVWSEAANYPALSYNRSLLSLAMSFSRSNIGDDIDTAASWRITSLGELYIKGTDPKFELFESDLTGDGAKFRIPKASGAAYPEWKFTLDKHDDSNPIEYFHISPRYSGFTYPNIEFFQRVYLSGSSSNSVQSLIISSKSSFDSDDLAPILITASDNDPNEAVLEDGNIWRKDNGTVDQLRVRLSGRTGFLCSHQESPVAKAWCLVKVTSGTPSLVGSDYNVSSVSLQNSGYNIRVNFSASLTEDKIVCLASMRSGDNYVLQILPEYPVTGGEISWVDIRAIQASTGSSIDFDTNDVQIYLVVFGVLLE